MGDISPPYLIMIRETLTKKDFKKSVTRDREKAYRQVINTWLKLPQNYEYAAQVIQQNKERRLQANDPFGGMKQNPKDLRIGLSIPVGLYYTLDKYEKMHDGEFMRTKADLWWFARKFPQFCIVERI